MYKWDRISIKPNLLLFLIIATGNINARVPKMCTSWWIRQDSTFWSLRQILDWIRGERLLTVVHSIDFLRILQKVSNIEQPRSHFLLQKEDNWWKYLSQLLLTSYFWSVSMENYCLFLIVFLHGAHPAFLTTYLISIFCLKLELTTYCFLKVWENIFELEIMKSDSCLTPSPFMLCQHTCRRTIWITLT